MAAKEKTSSFRHEGHVFFIYDHRVKTEEDDPKDAILYFYPRSFEVDDQVALVGGIIGIADFCLEFVPECMPNLLKLAGHNFALLHQGDFVIALAGSPDVPDKFLLGHMQFVWSTFVLYQGSLEAIRERVPAHSFVQELNLIWDMYLPLCQIQGDDLSQAFQALPYVQLHKTQASLFLHASHILQRSLRHNGVVAGALFNKNKILCSQLSNSLTRQLLLLMSHSQFPCVEAGSALELPGGVRLLYVFVPLEESSTLGHRRKKGYTRQTYSDGDEKKEKPQPKSRNSPASQDISDNVVRKRGGGKDQPSTSYGSRASPVGRESAISPSMGLTSGTDSEVFMDTLSEMNFDSKLEVKLSDIKEVECIASSKKLTPSSRTVETEVNTNTVEGMTNTDIGHAIEIVSQNKEDPPPSKTENSSTSNNLATDLSNLEISKSEVPSKATSVDNVSQSQEMKKESPVDIHLNNLMIKTSEDSAARENIVENIAASFVSKNDNEGSVVADLKADEKTEAPVAPSQKTSSDSKDIEKSIDLEKNIELGKNQDLEKYIDSGENKNLEKSKDVEKNLDSDKSKDAVENKNLEQSQNEIGKVVTDQKESNTQNEIIMSTTVSSVSDSVSDMEPQISIPTRSQTEGNVSNSTEAPKISCLSKSCPGLDHEKGGQINVDTNIEENNSSHREKSVLSNKETSICSEDQNKSEVGLKQEGQLETENKSDPSSICQGATSISDKKEKELYIQKTLAQSQREIDESLDKGLTDDDSSNSSSGVKLEDQDGSLLSLACADISSNKDRLTFESVDSENSETGIISPISEAGRLSPVAESDSILNENLSRCHSDVEEEAEIENKTRGTGSFVKELPVSEEPKSKDSGVEAKFDPEKQGLKEMILYAQGHSDTLLVLLMSKDTKCSRTYINSLWKSCLSHLAELDFEVKNAKRHVKDDSEVLGANYHYMRYDSFTQGLKGSAFQPVTSLANEMVDSSVKMHGDFIEFPDLQDSTYRSHSACSIGHRTPDSETYFQLGIPQASSGIIFPMDLTFSLQEVAEKVLQEETKISVL